MFWRTTFNPILSKHDLTEMRNLISDKSSSVPCLLGDLSNPVIIHIAFICMLVTHMVEGLRAEDRVVRKILRSLPQRFQPKTTAFEEIRDLNTSKVRELIGSLQTYEMKHLVPKKSKSIALKVVDKEDGEHQSEEFNGDEFAYLSRQFKKFFKNQNSKSHDLRNHSCIISKIKHSNYTNGYGYIASECANIQKKQNGKAKALNVTWSDSDSESESEENTIALITTISSDEAQQNNVHDREPNIDYVLEKYDDLLAASQKINKHNRELAKRVVVLELENSRTARMLQSSDAEPEIVETSREDTDLETHKLADVTDTDFEDCNQPLNPMMRRLGAKQVQKDHSPSDIIENVDDKLRT
ncbi:hypothetical protein L3X38_032923 [Prunus dulcis]|uniref:Uncharacterized protein n=1 Tax=Prunus dulcis TaxID=3755 RepID=A0AAD4VEZ9_PRUDU|nr:hypothetical protein L3X38_032923 [Prunus dulcis]